MCEKGRIGYFFEVKKAYDALLSASQRVMSITVKSAVPLTDEEKQRLKDKLESLNHCTADIQYVVDEALIGGVVIETDGKVIDGSIRNRLQQIEEVIGG